jgi:hypothetical protein
MMMNPTHIHLVLNHVAILGTIFSFVLLMAGITMKNETIRSLAFTGFVVSAVAAIPVFLTGESAEHAIKHLPGVVKDTIEEHEEAADVSFWLIEILGTAALASLFFGRKKFFSATFFMSLFALLGFTAMGAISYTGYLGGKIRHTEISGVTAVTNTLQNEAKDSDEEKEKD